MPEEQLQLEAQAERVHRHARGLNHRPRLIRIRSSLGRTPVAATRSQEEISEGSLPAATYRRDGVYRRTLGIADVVSATIAVLLGASVLGQDALNPMAVLALPLVLLVGKLTGIYDRDQHLLRKTTVDEIPTLFWVATLYTLLIWLGGDLIVAGQFGRLQAVGVWGLLFGSMLTTRALARYVARAASDQERCLVLGDADSAAWIARRFAEAPGLKTHVVGRVPLEPELPSSNGIPMLGDADALGPLLTQQRVERAIVAPRGPISDDLLNTIRRLKWWGMKVSLLPRLFEVVGSSAERDEVDGITLLGLRRYGLSRSSRVVKRGLDLAGSGLGLLVLAPLLATIAIAIKLESPGPVLFRQRRMGRDNVPFKMLKFRTMVAGAETQQSALAARNEADDGLFKIKDDPRITRVGKLLRRTSLDELPQLFNVLRGQMALVGPRPLVLDEDSRIEGWQRSRLQVPPGMTGPWQVFGSARIPLNEMVKIDYLYGANWSLWLDVKILLRTVSFVLRRQGL
jgi:exopolysaccharide biosynthesis polyprenyl glycosylphosphotransferase